MIGPRELLRRTPIHSVYSQVRHQMWARQWSYHEERMLQLYSAFLRTGDLCFDVGANIGNRSKVLLRLGARVVAVEPQAACARLLRAAFERDPRFTLEATAVGSAPGRARMFMSNVHTVSSMSRQWIDAVRASGRFTQIQWANEVDVPVITLDQLIERHGVPRFIKIDVEGFEPEVVRGLTRPVPALSLEFTPELAQQTIECITHLRSLGDITLNYSDGESMRFEWLDWVSPDRLLEHLQALRNDTRTFGDVYVRFRGM